MSQVEVITNDTHRSMITKLLGCMDWLDDDIGLKDTKDGVAAAHSGSGDAVLYDAKNLFVMLNKLFGETKVICSYRDDIPIADSIRYVDCVCCLDPERMTMEIKYKPADSAGEAKSKRQRIPAKHENTVAHANNEKQSGNRNGDADEDIYSFSCKEAILLVPLDENYINGLVRRAKRKSRIELANLLENSMDTLLD